MASTDDQDRAQVAIDQWLTQLSAPIRTSVGAAIAGEPRRRLALAIAKELDYQRASRYPEPSPRPR